MDWGRAKSVLIFAFLLLNLMLGYQLWSSIREGFSTNAGVNDLPAETLHLMEQKGIKLSASIPSNTPELGDLTFKLRKGEMIKLKQPVDSKIVFNEKDLQEGLGSVIPELNKYIFDSAYDKGNETAFVLYRTTKQLPIFDVKLELYYDNQKITAYRQDVIELVDTQNSPTQTVLPAATILKTLIERNLQNGAVIKDIKLGYHGPNFANSETQVSAPSWRVMLEDGNPSIYYVNAISAEVVTE